MSSVPHRFTALLLLIGTGEVSVTVLSQIYGYSLPPDQYRRTKKRDQDRSDGAASNLYQQQWDLLKIWGI